jgi:hypothetical protein
MVKNMWEFIKKGLSEGGDVSSKRMVTFFAFCIMCIVMISDLLFEIQIHEYIYDSFLYIVSVGLLTVAAEKFVRK